MMQQWASCSFLIEFINNHDHTCHRGHDSLAWHYLVRNVEHCNSHATPGLPYCALHGEHVRKAVEVLGGKTLDKDTGPIPREILQHLTFRGQGSMPNIMSRYRSSTARALRPYNIQQSMPHLGLLEKLPLEINQMIISELSFFDLRSFKAVNSHTHSMVVTNLAYSDIVTHASKVIRVLYRTELQSAWTVSQLYNIMRTSSCSGCERFGGYLYLPELKRCCQRCAIFDSDFFTLRVDEAEWWGIKDDPDYSPLPRMRYTIAETPAAGSNYLISQKNARVLPAVCKGYRFSYYHRNTEEPNNPTFHRPTVRRIDTLLQKWNLAVVPIPCLILQGTAKAKSIKESFGCKGCASVKTGYCNPECVQVSLPGGMDIQTDEPEAALIDGATSSVQSCKIKVQQSRLYTLDRESKRDDIVSHLVECPEAYKVLEDLEKEKGRPAAISKAEKPRKQKKKQGNKYKY